MTDALAIVDSVEEAVLAARVGFKRIAVWTDASAVKGAALSFSAREVSVSLLFSELAESAIEPDDLVRMVLAAGCRSIGLPPEPSGHRFIKAAAGAGLNTVGLVNPARMPDEAQCREAAGAGLTGLLVTSGSAGERIVDRLGIPALAAAVARCHDLNLTVALAGGLEPADVPRLLAIGPDELGFDHALRDEAGRFDAAASQAILELMRTPALATRPAESGTRVWDRIFVRDWTVAMSIGVYARERHLLQRVRFNVDAEVLPSQAREAGLLGVVSYDLITDGIARLSAAHVDLVEQVAERLAELVLAHPRVMRVDITVEKLDVGAGSLGCRIVRDRTSLG